MSPTEDLELIQRAAEGDCGAFTELVQKYENFVYNIVFHSLRNADDAFDVSQEVFIRVYKSLGSFRGSSKFSTWLYTVAMNVIRDSIRSSKHRIRAVSLSPDDGEGGEKEFDIPDRSETSNPEEMLEKKERAKAVREGIRNLSEDHREVILLRDIEGYTYEEIALMLSIDIGTVKSRLNRARNSLKKYLSERNIF